MRARRENEQGFTVGVKDQRVRDLADLHPECRRGGRCSRHRIRQDAHPRDAVRVGTTLSEGRCHEFDVAVGGRTH